MAEETETTNTVEQTPPVEEGTPVGQTVDQAAATPTPEPTPDPAQEAEDLRRTLADMTLEMAALKKAQGAPTETPAPAAETPDPAPAPAPAPAEAEAEKEETEKPYDPYMGKPTGDPRLDAMEKQMQEISTRQQLDNYAAEHGLSPEVRAEVEKMLPETSGNIAVAHAAVIGNSELRQAQGGVPETVVNPAQYNTPQTDDIAAEKAEFYRQATENAQRAKIPPLTSF